MVTTTNPQKETLANNYNTQLTLVGAEPVFDGLRSTQIGYFHFTTRLST